jgi:threonylcarbamoyladenosine tRNA methylthiotransferase MtaB
MPQVDHPSIRRRAARLRSAAADNRARWMQSLVGTQQRVLIEKSGTKGHAENFAPVTLPSPRTPGSIYEARIVGTEKDALIAQEDIPA